MNARLAPFPVASFLIWAAVTGLWWAFALAPLPDSEVWLLRARAVCFGSLPNGLPETWGWMLLVLGPLSMLGFLAAVWGGELRSSVRWLARRPSGAALLTLLALGTIGGAGAVAGRIASAHRLAATVAGVLPTDALPPDYPRGIDAAPELALLDQNGASIALAQLAGRPTVVTFAFAHCTTVCPVLVATLRRSFELRGADAPALVIVTLDPWRDTPGSLPTLAAGWGIDQLANAHVLSGAPEAVERVRESWQVPADRDASTGNITHPGLVFVIDAQGRLAYRFLNPSPAWVVEALARLDRERA